MSSTEHDLARGVYGDLKEIKGLLKEAPIDTAWAARKLRRIAKFWVVDYEERGIPRPKDLDRLISHVETLAKCLVGQVGASTEEMAVGHAEREARTCLRELDAACMEAKGNLKCSRDGCALLEARRQNITSELQRKATQIEEYERMVELARKEMVELLEQKDGITKHLEFCDEALTSLCNSIKHLDERHADVTALVDKTSRKKELEARSPSDIATILAYPIKDLSETDPPGG
ncbi:hypothetical protein SEVIR_5G089001v4 [Setaria viridis]|nr:uncharacterized protein LOC117858670 [Setaria viridis]XP_034597668.1 uncharacterized protein LOC117858670 [Setaria viridis]